jgi:hypothetical protein
MNGPAIRPTLGLTRGVVPNALRRPFVDEAQP